MTNSQRTASSRRAPPVLAIASLAFVIANAPAGAESPATSAIVHQTALDKRVWAPKLLPRHMRALSRADRSGDTPYSAARYAIANITLEVNGFAGAAYAVNDDGRIAYSDFGNLTSVG